MNSDLISREWLLKQPLDTSNYPSNYVKSAPSADIMECARAIKEYCERERINCVECPFYNCERDLSCVLCDPCMSWDLPEGEKE